MIATSGAPTRPSIATRAGCVLVGCLLAAAMLLGPAPVAEAGKSKKVGCFTSTFPAPGQDPVFRKKPRKCIFIDKDGLSAPVPPARAVQVTQRMRWSNWGKARSKGRGFGFVGSNQFPIAVRATLWKPKKRCGRRAYSKVKFRFPQTGVRIGPFDLLTC